MRNWLDKSEQEFLAAVQEPQLLVPFREGRPSEAPFDTGKMALRGAGSLGAQALRVLPLKKRTDQAFTLMITLGRAGNNDLVLPSPAISKFHLYFRQENSHGSWSVCDANSLNGTVLNRKQLAPEKATPITSGDLLEIAGHVVVEFVHPPELFARIQGEGVTMNAPPLSLVQWSGNEDDTRRFREEQEGATRTVPKGQRPSPRAPEEDTDPALRRDPGLDK